MMAAAHPGSARPVPHVWLLVAVLIGAFVVASTSFGRFFHWDEAVFWSQVHDFRGSGAPASELVASRELGSVLVLRLFDVVTNDLATTRFLWAALSVALMLVVFRRIGAFFGPWAGPIGALVFGSFWVTGLLVDALYANQLGALFQLGAVGTYLAIRRDENDRARNGFVLGLLLAGAFWMRQLESVLVLCVLLGDSVVRRPTLIWRSRLKAIGAAAVTFALTFAVPWAVDSTRRFGSVANRLELARSQDFGRGVVNNAETYLATIVGRSVHIRSTAPRWSITLAVLAMLGATALTITMVVVSRRRREPGASARDRGALGLLVVLALVLCGFFFFWIETARDRYLMSGTAFTAAVAGAIIGWAVEGITRLSPTRRKMAAAAFLAVMVAWLGGQTAMARHHKHVWDVVTWEAEQGASLVRTLAAGRPCSGLARYGRPLYQVGSGCRVETATDPTAARAKLERYMESSAFVFVVWPSRTADDLQLDEPWQRIVMKTKTSSITIWYRDAPEDP